MGYNAEDRVAVITDEQCWELLESSDLAHLAVSVRDRPDIYPLSYLAHKGKLYLRTSQGSKLLQMTINSLVALVVTRVSDADATSVVVHGQARQLTAALEVEAADRLPIRRRLPIVHPVYVEITPDSVEGRHFDFSPSAT